MQQLTLPTIQELIQPYQHYPKVIQQALLMVDSHPTLSGLTRSFRRVLKALVTRCSKRDGCALIQARVDRLAIEASVSEKTVQRALQFLRKLTWLRQVSDGRDDHGSFSFREYQIAPELAQLLRLPNPSASAQQTKMSDGLYIDLNFKEDHQKISSKTEPGKATPVELPPELATLPEELGIKDTGIAALRGQAFKAGHQLEHIVACARTQLKKLNASGNRAYRYLQTMIAKPSDYAGRAAQAGRVEAQKENTVRAKADADKYRGKRFKAPNGDIFRVNDCGAVATLSPASGGACTNFAGSDMQILFGLIQSGKLKPME